MVALDSNNLSKRKYTMDFNDFNKTKANFINAKKDLPFKKISEIDTTKIYKVNGIFPVKSKFGLRYFVSLENDNMFFNFDLPKSQNDNAITMRENGDFTKAINDGECGVKLSSYYSKKYGTNCVNVEWCNIIPF